jgi:molybdate transport system substrate-binding protein
MARLAWLGVLLLAGWRVPAAAAPVDAGPVRELTVFGAASLREAFERLAPAFERAHPRTRVRLNFGGSQELRTQLEQGAPADVFAPADARTMALARQAHLVGPARPLATNEPVVVVPRDNPAHISSFAELPSARRLVLGAPEVPIGAYTLEVLARARANLGQDFPARVQSRVVSRELNVRQVLTKVLLGEADAGIVYRTDARAAGDAVRVLPIPKEINVVAEYPIALTTRTTAPGLAQAWVDAVTGPEGKAILTELGFGAVPSTDR